MLTVWCVELNFLSRVYSTIVSIHNIVYLKVWKQEVNNEIYFLYMIFTVEPATIGLLLTYEVTNTPVN